MRNFFNIKSKQLEGTIDGYLDRVTTAGLTFNKMQEIVSSRYSRQSAKSRL